MSNLQLTPEQIEAMRQTLQGAGFSITPTQAPAQSPVQVPANAASTVPSAASAPIPLPNQAAPNENLATAQTVQAPANPGFQMEAPQMRDVGSTTTVKGTEAEREALAKAGREQESGYNKQLADLKKLGKDYQTANTEADKLLGTREERQQRYNEIIETNRAELDANLKQMDEQIATLKATEFKDFWADKGTANKIVTALAVGLGAYAATMTGTQNMAWNILQKAMDDDFRLQEAKYNKQIRNIEMLKLGADQKQRLMDVATRDFDLYKVGRAEYVSDKIDQMRLARGDLPKALMDIEARVNNEKNNAKTNALNNQINNTVTQSQKQMTAPRIMSHEEAKAERADKTSRLYKFNTAMDDYQQVQSFKNSKNYNATVIKLISNGLDQGSYNPDNFDATARSFFEKVGDKWKLKVLSKGEEQVLVKAAEKYFQEQAIAEYKNFKDDLPMYQKASAYHSFTRGGGGSLTTYANAVPKEIQDIAEGRAGGKLESTGATKISDNKK